MASSLTNDVIGLLKRILLVLLILIVGIQAIKVLRKLLKKSMERAHLDQGVIQFADSFAKTALAILLVFMVAAKLGVDAASIVALLGSAGVAIGLAIQGSLSNLAGGMLILFLKPFKVGDYIIEGTGKQEGTVTEIQIFYTQLTTADNHVVYLPNGSLANNSIVNLTALKKRRLDVFVSISYDSDLKLAKQVLSDMLEQDEKSLKDMEHFVYVDELGDSGVLLGVRCFVTCDDYWETKWRLTENCKLVLEQNGITIAYPQMDVHLKGKMRDFKL